MAPSRAAGPRCGFLRLRLPHPSQELLGRLRGRVLELQAEKMDLDPLQQGHSLAEAWETRAAAPAGLLGPGDSVLQALRGIRSPRMKRDSGCFGRKLDRIGSLSGLGCNGEHPPPIPTACRLSGFEVSGPNSEQRTPGYHSFLPSVLRVKERLSGNIKF